MSVHGLSVATDIRTYGVVTLNEECGFIQWVPNTIPFRPVVVKGYDRRSIRWWVSVLADTSCALPSAQNAWTVERHAAYLR